MKLAVIDTNVIVAAQLTRHDNSEAVLALFDDDAKLVTGNAKHFPPAPFVISPADFAKQLD